MPKPALTFVFKVLRHGLLRYILYTFPNLWYRSCSKCWGRQGRFDAWYFGFGSPLTWGIAKPALCPLQITAFLADSQILEEVDSCALTLFSGATTNHNGGTAVTLYVRSRARGLCSGFLSVFPGRLLVIFYWFSVFPKCFLIISICGVVSKIPPCCFEISKYFLAVFYCRSCFLCNYLTLHHRRLQNQRKHPLHRLHWCSGWISWLWVADWLVLAQPANAWSQAQGPPKRVTSVNQRNWR